MVQGVARRTVRGGTPPNKNIRTGGSVSKRSAAF